MNKQRHLYILIATMVSCGSPLASNDPTTITKRGVLSKIEQDNANTEQIAGTLKDKIYRQRINAVTPELEQPAEFKTLNLVESGAGQILADSEVLDDISYQVFGSRLDLTAEDKQVTGTFNLRNATPLRLIAPTQQYIQLLRVKFYPKCVSLVQSELDMVATNNPAPRKLVDSTTTLSTESVHKFMVQAFGTPSAGDTLHAGAAEYSRSFSEILTQNPKESVESIYSVMCLSIITDPRVYLR